ncbi:LPS assembly protein LptD [Devosia sp. XJ19-1]|uniref:LPS-assembly protein LptD n=1 Tax=Devosia ureilytica TaxID=2952754 RepID=A0A9Q4FRZ8_9HYPH|nr:LPS assembly protein LptD [Devosia ureilytica]MCP8884398.1 LPS assembly protein LptD [Devosia ureilytica]MCP8888006.1 LPS assembly protein LptD [Devosia ureilytica]
MRLPRALALAMAVTVLAGPAHAQGLLPEDFFAAPIDPSAPTAVEAEELVFDSVRNEIMARGDVVLRVSGYTLSGERLVYRRADGEMELVGNVIVIDPAGNRSHSDRLSLTDGLKRTVLDSMTLTATDGARITADSAEFDKVLSSILINASYAPCGECISPSGKRIGWSISAARIVQNSEDNSITLEQPSIALLGVPVAWLPYLWLPDLSNQSLDGIPRPSLAYSEEIGVKAEVPFTVYSSRDTSVILSPTLLSGQGFLMGAEWIQRFDRGLFNIKASGLYQFNKMAFSFPDAQRDWRGAVQAAGEFRPVEDWTVGAAYSVFTDSAYFADYLLDPKRSAVNEVYATHLTDDTYVDARIQQFNLLGNTTDQKRDQQGIALPNVQVARTFTLPNGGGRVEVEGRLLVMSRAADSSTTVNGIPYDYGYAGNRAHGMAQASWQNQWIAGGAVVTPFLGVRLDAASYDGNSGLASAPAAQTLLSATPIAALDVRYPMAAYGGGVTHLIEPIGQIVYRGASSTAPGITNEDSQSLVFDDTNVFSYNRFTGIDRQETGLRLNVGGRYLATLDDGSYLELLGGQSFQLAGDNAFALANRQQVGVGSGLENAASYAVLGAYGSLADTLNAGGKLQIDTSSLAVSRAGLGVSYGQDGWSGALNYGFAAATPATGNDRDMHEIGVELSVPVAEYWTVSSNAYWDIASGSYLQIGGGAAYNDGYLAVSGAITRTGPTHNSPNDLRATASFKLLAPAGLGLGYSGAVPLAGWLQ